jgi:hypothetical protein
MTLITISTTSFNVWLLEYPRYLSLSIQFEPENKQEYDCLTSVRDRYFNNDKYEECYLLVCDAV